MPTNFGYSRDIPLAGEGGAGGGPNGTAPRGMSPQEAVRLFSLRVPERQSQGAIAPVPLMTSKGSGAAGASGLDSMVAALMRAFGGGGPGAPAPAQAPVLSGSVTAPMLGGGGQVGDGGPNDSNEDLWRVPNHHASPELAPHIEFARDPVPSYGVSQSPAPHIGFGGGQPPEPPSAAPTDDIWRVPDQPDNPGPNLAADTIERPEPPGLFDDGGQEQPWWLAKNEGLFGSDF